MGGLSVWHWLIVAGVVVLLFGASKLPQLARSLGQSARVFKAETRSMREEEEAASKGKDQQQLTSGASGTPRAASTSEQPHTDSAT